MENIQLETDYKVVGYRNKWSVIDTYDNYALLENNTYGDETCYLVAEIEDNVSFIHESPTVLHVVCETFDDLMTALEDAGIL